MSNITRDLLDLGLDEYCGFYWNGHNSKEFNMFIINSNNSSNAVGFYNGPSFSNEYSRPQFERANSNFLGVSFQTQKIKFKVGIYNFSIDEYRKVRKWLDEYTISKLAFDFDSKWGYEVKLANIQDSERYIIGCKKVNETFVDTYYTEFDLEFDVQGEPCAISTLAYEVELSNPNKDATHLLAKIKKGNGEKVDYVDSFLDTPIVANLSIENVDKAKDFSVTLFAKEGDPTEENNNFIELFTVTLGNLSAEPGSSVNLRYDSESGIVYIQFGDGTKKILSLVSSNVNGKRIVSAIKIHKFKIPGGMPTSNYYFEAFINGGNGVTFKINPTGHSVSDVTSTKKQTTFEIFARTNIV